MRMAYDEITYEEKSVKGGQKAEWIFKQEFVVHNIGRGIHPVYPKYNNFKNTSDWRPLLPFD